MILYFIRDTCETPPQDLPSHDTGGDNRWCDVCIKKSKVKEEAVIYCKQCDKKFCTKHEEVRTVNSLCSIYELLDYI